MKKAFTLPELAIVMIIIAIIALVMIQTLKPEKYSQKTNQASAMKVIEYVNQASVQIMDLEKEKCPARSFMVKPAGTSTWEFAILNDSGSTASAQEVAELFGEHLKYESDILDFCDYTDFCTNDDIKGAKLAGEAYIGFELFDSVDDCPAYYFPGDENQTPAPKITEGGIEQTRKCWGKLYIDANGQKGPDTEGQDIFVFGLAQDGIVR